MAVNPGSTTTKIGLFRDDVRLHEQTLKVPDGLRALNLWEQLAGRLDQVRGVLSRWETRAAALSAVVARGGLMRPLASGTYTINQRMLADLKSGLQGQHASNLGAAMAWEMAAPANLPCFVVDPVSVDEFEPLARLSGLPELPRRSLLHALNMKAAARRAAADLGVPVERSSFVLCHLGGGISVAPCRAGALIDANNANEEGPFGPERAGGVPSLSLADLCFSGRHTWSDLQRRLVGGGGMAAYLGTADAESVLQRVAEGDAEATLVMRAMAYQVAKEIGAMATVLLGQVDAVVLSGGLARSPVFTSWVEERVRFLGKVLVYPGEDEMLALVQGALRVLKGEESAKAY